MNRDDAGKSAPERQPVHGTLTRMDDDVTDEIRPKPRQHLVNRQRPPVYAFTKTRDLLNAERVGGSRLLFIMHAEGAEESRQARDRCPGVLEPKQEVPVERVTEARVNPPS